MQSGDSDLLTLMRSAALEAGALALAFFSPGVATSARIDWKVGDSPVSEADYAVDVFLRERLGALMPDAGWLSEETADSPERLSREHVFIVDPIDGTRGFIKGDPRWAISIALVTRGQPQQAVLHLPALNETFTATAGAGAFLNETRISAASGAVLAIADELTEDGLVLRYRTDTADDGLRGECDIWFESTVLAPLQYASGRIALEQMFWRITLAVIALRWLLILSLGAIFLPWRDPVLRRLTLFCLL